MKNLILIFLGVSLSFSILAQQPAAPKGKLKPFPRIEHKNRTESKGFAATKSSDFAEDFETGATTWSIGGLWQVGQPTSGPMGAYSNLNCAATNLSGNYNNYVNDWLISPAISLPSDVTYISLKFFEWFELESDYDYGIVKISEDNWVTWNQIDIRTGFSEWRETIIDITAYKGKNVLFAFNLTSDGSVTYSGWYIDAISIESDGVIGPDASIMSFNSQNFPQIYMNISVNTPLSLTQSDFKVYENGVLQTNLFEVTPPESSGGSRVADIVFVVDVTGSMYEEIESVKANMVNFLNAINSSGIDYRIGLVVYGDIYYVYNSYNFYGNYDEILSLFNNISIGENGIGDGADEPENQVGSMVEASKFYFRPGAQRIEILLTDAPSHVSDGVTTWTVESLLNERLIPNHIMVFPIFDVSDGAQTGQYLPISNATNPSGSYFNIYDNFNDIVNEITSTVGSTYVLRYSSGSPDCDNLERNVDVKINVDGTEITKSTSYFPCESPTIKLTTETKDLQTVAWAENTAFTIIAEITDNYSPYVINATLYYKNSSETVYKSVDMVNTSGNLWSGQIPSGDVLQPGVDYYITATDDIFTVSDPVSDPSLVPYQIAILPNKAPVIRHTVITGISVGVPQEILAEASDITNSLISVKLFYRKRGQITYQVNEMVLQSGSIYKGIIPADYCTSDGFEYYISAWDNFNIRTDFASPSSPCLIVGEPSGLIRPLMKSPESVTQSSFVATWYPSATALGYRLTVATDEDFISILPGYNNLNVYNVTSFTISGLDPYTTYYYKVKAYNFLYVSSFSDINEVRTFSIPSTPPGNVKSSSCNNMVSLSWDKSEGEYFLKYRIYGGTSDEPTTVLDSISDDISIVTSEIANLKEDSTYFFRITAVNIDGVESDFSNSTFVLVKTGVIPRLKTKWNDVLVCYNIGDSITAYTWYKDGLLIPNADKQYYITNKISGVYNVETTDNSGCKNVSAGISMGNAKSIFVYPNPVSSSYSIKANSVSGGAYVRIIDSYGTKKMEFNVEDINDSSLSNIPLNNLEKGVYFIQVSMSSGEILNTKFIVTK